ncbi:TcfC E-set like domain-containing protein [Microbulbifer zhoushanensis]|uniref:TcfC E-set like domain-containing protein n=1 Tax=Microbulbifer zhoushanensis TaxID=2904254 RepID=UPI001F1FB981|nr:TcfC E-set like domain-containing protein [Microbulbifer zhoushanensis]
MKYLTAAVIFTAACYSCPTAGTAAFTLETAPPAGFDDLTEPQQLVADLYFGGRMVGAVAVTVTPGQVSFDEPAAVMALLPEALPPEQVIPLLQGEHPTNAHRICRRGQDSGCGFLEPNDFALIYDEDRFRVDLFFAPHLLPRRTAVEDPYLPESSSDVSYIHSLSGSWSGIRTDAGPDDTTASLFGRSVLGFGESGVHAQWATGNERGAELYQLNWAQDYRGRAWAAGLIQPQQGFSSFAAAPYLYGLEYRSSYNSRTDNRQQQGAPLEVNMPLRGRVEVYRDGRLLHSELLEAGNQLLDTSTLPGGAYEIEVRSFDESGRPLAQFTQFFAKDARLPAPGEWRWSLQLGRPAQLSKDLMPTAAGDYLVSGGLARRIHDSAGVFASAAATETEQLLEVGARWVTPFVAISPSLLQTADGRQGHRLTAQVTTPWFRLNASESYLENAQKTRAADNFSLLGRGFRQRNASASREFWDGQLTLRYSSREFGGAFVEPDFELDTGLESAGELITLEYRRNILRNRNWLGDLTLAHSEADGRPLSTASLQFRARDKHWGHGTRARSEYSETGFDNRVGVDSTWNDRDTWAAELEQRLTAETAGGDHFLGSRTRLSGHRGYLDSSLQWTDSAGTEAFNYVGSFSTNLAGDGDTIAWGGERPYQSAVVVDIDGSPEEDFEILVNGVRRGYARGEQRSVVNLPSFDTYEVSLRPLSDGFHDYTETSESLTLYPGNVARARYRIQPLILALGRIVRNGRPEAKARITIGEYSTVTDENGVFQMEMHGDPRALTLPPVRWKGCHVALPDQIAGKHWINLGEIDLGKAECEPASARLERTGEQDA